MQLFAFNGVTKDPENEIESENIVYIEMMTWLLCIGAELLFSNKSKILFNISIKPRYFIFVLNLAIHTRRNRVSFREVFFFLFKVNIMPYN